VTIHGRAFTSPLHHSRTNPAPPSLEAAAGFVLLHRLSPSSFPPHESEMPHKAAALPASSTCRTARARPIVHGRNTFSCALFPGP
jgi:hypothetical protein